MAPVHSVPGHASATPPPDVRVRRRTVFYVSGFDPQGPGHYYRLFKEQAALQGQVTDYRLTVGPRVTTERLVSTWSVAFDGPDGSRVDSTYCFLRWDDIVREHWPRGRWELARVTLWTSARLLANGSWLSMCRASWVAGLTLAWPLGVALLGAGMALAAWAAGACLLASASLSAASSLSSIATLVALAAGSGSLPWLWRFGQGDWLMRSTASLLRYARGQAPEIDARVDAWAHIIRSSLKDKEADEVLVVAHSSGCIAAVSALVRALNLTPNQELARRPVSLLTLGQCIPVLSHQPEAVGFRAALAALGRSAHISWVDVTAPPDACCFALMDPCASPHQVQGLESLAKRLSPRYAEQMSARSYRTIRRNKLRCHFQYLMAFEDPRHYDFFRWVSGPQTLANTTQALKSVTNFNRFRW